MHHLESLERAGWDALCAGTGGQFYGSLMMPDAVMVLAHGAVLDRDEVVASLDEAPPWTSYQLSDVRRVPLGPEASALVYRGEASRPGQDFVALMTSCYVRHEGDWRLAVYQQTVMP
ncbi:MAG: nuclear transport factor 2 family protein [Angustibacter sp.]